ncbi:enoyl-CoA hydratase/isomerase family protein [Mesorhizobium sp. A556]
MTAHPFPSQAPRLTISDGVARIILQRPAHRNRIHSEDLALLYEMIGKLNADRSVRVVVLSAEVLDDKPIFCAGFNIQDFDAGPPPVSFDEVTRAIERMRPVTICALNGTAYGGGVDLVLGCDLILAAEGVALRVTAAKLGIYYHGAGLRRFISRAGVGLANQIFLTAEPIAAATLLDVGCFSKVLPPAELDAHVDQLARHITTLAPLAVEAMKQTLAELSRDEYDAAQSTTRGELVMASEDFAEGRRAFAERRAPVWKGC